MSARLWSAPAERSGDGALAWLAQVAAGAKAGSRFACPRTPNLLREFGGLLRGGNEASLSRIPGVPVWRRCWRPFSLSPRERAGVRGKTTPDQLRLPMYR